MSSSCESLFPILLSPDIEQVNLHFPDKMLDIETNTCWIWVVTGNHYACSFKFNVSLSVHFTKGKTKAES